MKGGLSWQTNFIHPLLAGRPCLATKLLNRKTHLLGIIRKNKKGLPDSITQKQIDKGQVIGKESLDGIVVGNRKDKREVCFLLNWDKIDIEATGKKKSESPANNKTFCN